MKKFLILLICFIVTAMSFSACSYANKVTAPEISIDGDLLSWTPVDGAEFYSLRILFDDLNGYEILTKETSYKAKFVKKGDYTFSVRAYKDGTYSKYSNKVVYTQESDHNISESDDKKVIYRGSGTIDDPILIESAKHLLSIKTGTRKEVINDVSQTTQLYFKQTCDIDLEGKEVAPLCTGSNRFQGFYDGDGYTISNFKQTELPKSGYIYMGLFGSIEAASIINLKITNYNTNVSYISKGFGWGAIAGYSKESVIENCSVEATININSPSNSTNMGYIGLLVGESLGTTFVRCMSKGEINATFSKVYAGGIAGTTNIGTKDVLSNCYSNAKITTHSTGRNAGVVEASSYAGGLIGYATAFSDVNCSVSNSQLKATAIDGANPLTIGVGIFGGGKYRNADGYSLLIYKDCYLNYEKAGLQLSEDYPTVEELIRRFAIGGKTAIPNNQTVVFGFNNSNANQQSTFEKLDFDNIWSIENGELCLKEYKATHKTKN